MEEWKDVNYKEFGKKYSVSNKGNVKNKNTGKILIPAIRMGYYAVCLSDIIKKTVSVHTLVALSFLEKNDKKKNVNHIDGNKLNNASDNLEWTTAKENTQHALKNDLIKPHTAKVEQYTKEGVLIKKFDSIKMASEETGTSDRHISDVCKGKRKSTGGFIWKYVDNGNMIPCDADETVEHKVVSNFPNYSVTPTGKVYSKKTKKYLIPKISEGGYECVKLSKDGKTKDKYVHILVAELYLKKIDDCIVNHKDGNKTNNNKENLEWITESENAKHYQKYLKKPNTKLNIKN